LEIRISENDAGCPVCLLRGAMQPEATVKADLADDGRFDQYEMMRREDGTFEELGRGAVGVTYKAFDVDLRFPVTLKLISEKYVGDESARLRFLREARAAASVRHPNVASVFHLGRTGQNYFYAMEFVEGETLGSLIKRSGRLDVKLALEIATQVAAGLAAVHKQKLVHRDIKPSNIMVSVEEEGAVTAKIIDLGLAKVVNESGSQNRHFKPISRLTWHPARMRSSKGLMVDLGVAESTGLEPVISHGRIFIRVVFRGYSKTVMPSCFVILV
jgi:serine/threonine protein kinase